MSNYNSSQIQQIQELGAYLCQQRLSQSLTIEQIAMSTFIRLSMLKALEQGQVEQLPELVYVQGFVRRYGEALNLDGYSLAARLLFQQTEELSSKISPESMVFPPVESLGEDLPSSSIRTHTSTKMQMWSKLKVYGSYTLFLGGVFTGLFYLFSAFQSSEPSSQNRVFKVVKTLSEETQDLASQNSQTASNTLEPISPKFNTVPATQDVSQKPVDTRTEKPLISTADTDTKGDNAPSVNHTTSESSQGTIPSNLNLDNPVAASVLLEEDSWIRVKIDGKTKYEGILGKGTQQTWTAQKILIIRAGNAGAVNLVVNDKPSRRLGNIGEVQEVTLTANN